MIPGITVTETPQHCLLSQLKVRLDRCHERPRCTRQNIEFGCCVLAHSAGEVFTAEQVIDVKLRSCRASPPLEVVRHHGIGKGVLGQFEGIERVAITIAHPIHPAAERPMIVG